nr:DUF1643 domain-containing protein [Agromyces sp. Leaf222]
MWTSQSDPRVRGSSGGASSGPIACGRVGLAQNNPSASAKREGFVGMVANLYAFRTKDPKVMKATGDPVGPDNDRILTEITGTVVAGWGTNADQDRVAQVVALLPPLHALGVTKFGHPQHPLYVPADAPLLGWKPRGQAPSV